LGKVLGAAGEEIVDKAKSGRTQFFNTPEGVAAVTAVPSLNWYIAAVLPVTIADTVSGGTAVLFLMIIAVFAAMLIIFYVFVARNFHFNK